MIKVRRDFGTHSNKTDAYFQKNLINCFNIIGESKVKTMLYEWNGMFYIDDTSIFTLISPILHGVVTDDRESSD